jgi:hypothetical protein
VHRAVEDEAAGVEPRQVEQIAEQPECWPARREGRARRTRYARSRSARRLVPAGDGCWLLVGERGLELRDHAQSHASATAAHRQRGLAHHQRGIEPPNPSSRHFLLKDTLASPDHAVHKTGAKQEAVSCGTVPATLYYKQANAHPPGHPDSVRCLFQF